MAASYTLYHALAGQQTFAVPFPYLLQTDVQIFINGVQQTINTDYVWLNAGSIQLFGSLIANADVLVQRQTSPNSVDVTYTPGAVLTAAQLNTANLQNFYRTQEIQDQLDQYISGGLDYYNIAGGGTMSAEQLIDSITQQILSSQLLQTLNQSLTDIDSNGQAILDQTDRVNTLQTTVDALAALGSELGGLATFLQQEQTQRIQGDSALAQQIDLIGAVSGDNLSFILDQQTVMVDPTTSLADYITGIDSQFGSINGTVAAVQASITSEATTRASADNALATQVSNLSATVTSNNTTLQSLISSLSSSLATNYSTTAQLQTYVGSQIVTATNSLTAAIQSNYVTSASLNGLTSATYTLQTQVTSGGTRYVAGFGLMNNGGSGSSFIVEANQFAIVDPGNGVSAATVPFVVSDGTVYMRNIVVQDALIDHLQISKLTQGALNADMEIGSGHVIFNNGSYIKVQGVGFGSSNQFIDWYGPLITSGANQNWDNGADAPVYGGFKEGTAITYSTTTGIFYADISTLKQSSGTNVITEARPATTVAAYPTMVLNQTISSGQIISSGKAQTGTVSLNLSGPNFLVTSVNSGGGEDDSQKPQGTSWAVTIAVTRKNVKTGATTNIGTHTFTGQAQSNVNVLFNGDGSGVTTTNWFLTLLPLSVTPFTFTTTPGVGVYTYTATVTSVTGPTFFDPVPISGSFTFSVSEPPNYGS